MPELSEIRPSARYDGFVASAASLIEKEEFRDAVRQISKAIGVLDERTPEIYNIMRTDLLYSRGLVRLRIGEVVKAQKDFAACKRNRGNECGPFLGAAFCCEHRGNLADAESEYSAAIGRRLTQPKLLRASLYHNNPRYRDGQREALSTPVAKLVANPVPITNTGEDLLHSEQDEAIKEETDVLLPNAILTRTVGTKAAASSSFKGIESTHLVADEYEGPIGQARDDEQGGDDESVLSDGEDISDSALVQASALRRVLSGTASLTRSTASLRLVPESAAAASRAPPPAAAASQEQEEEEEEEEEESGNRGMSRSRAERAVRFQNLAGGAGSFGNLARVPSIPSLGPTLDSRRQANPFSKPLSAAPAGGDPVAESETADTEVAGETADQEGGRGGAGGGGGGGGAGGGVGGGYGARSVSPALLLTHEDVDIEQSYQVVTPLLLRALFYFRLGNHAGAEEDCRRVLGKYVRNPLALLILSESLRRRSNRYMRRHGLPAARVAARSLYDAAYKQDPTLAVQFITSSFLRPGSDVAKMALSCFRFVARMVELLQVRLLPAAAYGVQRSLDWASQAAEAVRRVGEKASGAATVSSFAKKTGVSEAYILAKSSSKPDLAAVDGTAPPPRGKETAKAAKAATQGAAGPAPPTVMKTVGSEDELLSRGDGAPAGGDGASAKVRPATAATAATRNKTFKRTLFRVLETANVDFGLVWPHDNRKAAADKPAEDMPAKAVSTNILNSSALISKSALPVPPRLGTMPVPESSYAQQMKRKRFIQAARDAWIGGEAPALPPAATSGGGGGGGRDKRKRSLTGSSQASHKDEKSHSRRARRGSKTSQSVAKKAPQQQGAAGGGGTSAAGRRKGSASGLEGNTAEGGGVAASVVVDDGSSRRGVRVRQKEELVMTKEALAKGEIALADARREGYVEDEAENGGVESRTVNTPYDALFGSTASASSPEMSPRAGGAMEPQPFEDTAHALKRLSRAHALHSEGSLDRVLQAKLGPDGDRAAAAGTAAAAAGAKSRPVLELATVAPPAGLRKDGLGMGAFVVTAAVPFPMPGAGTGLHTTNATAPVSASKAEGGEGGGGGGDTTTAPFSSSSLPAASAAPGGTALPVISVTLPGARQPAAAATDAPAAAAAAGAAGAARGGSAGSSRVARRLDIINMQARERRRNREILREKARAREAELLRVLREKEEKEEKERAERVRELWEREKKAKEKKEKEEKERREKEEREKEEKAVIDASKSESPDVATIGDLFVSSPYIPKKETPMPKQETAYQSSPLASEPKSKGKHISVIGGGRIRPLSLDPEPEKDDQSSIEEGVGGIGLLRKQSSPSAAPEKESAKGASDPAAAATSPDKETFGPPKIVTGSVLRTPALRKSGSQYKILRPSEVIAISAYANSSGGGGGGGGTAGAASSDSAAEAAAPAGPTMVKSDSKSLLRDRGHGKWHLPLSRSGSTHVLSRSESSSGEAVDSGGTSRILAGLGAAQPKQETAVPKRGAAEKRRLLGGAEDKISIKDILGFHGTEENDLEARQPAGARPGLAPPSPGRAVGVRVRRRARRGGAAPLKSPAAPTSAKFTSQLTRGARLLVEPGTGGAQQRLLNSSKAAALRRSSGGGGGGAPQDGAFTARERREPSTIENAGFLSARSEKPSRERPPRTRTAAVAGSGQVSRERRKFALPSSKEISSLAAKRKKQKSQKPRGPKQIPDRVALPVAQPNEAVKLEEFRMLDRGAPAPDYRGGYHRQPHPPPGASMGGKRPISQSGSMASGAAGGGVVSRTGRTLRSSGSSRDILHSRAKARKLAKLASQKHVPIGGTSLDLGHKIAPAAAARRGAANEAASARSSEASDRSIGGISMPAASWGGDSRGSSGSAGAKRSSQRNMRVHKQPGHARLVLTEARLRQNRSGSPIAGWGGMADTEEFSM